MVGGIAGWGGGGARKIASVWIGSLKMCIFLSTHQAKALTKLSFQKLSFLTRFGKDLNTAGKYPKSGWLREDIVSILQKKTLLYFGSHTGTKPLCGSNLSEPLAWSSNPCFAMICSQPSLSCSKRAFSKCKNKVWSSLKCTKLKVKSYIF